MGMLKSGEVVGERGVGEVKEPASNFPVGEWGAGAALGRRGVGGEARRGLWGQEQGMQQVLTS